MGGSVASTSTPCTDQVGTMPFVAPEVLKACSTQHGYDAAPVDIWACAVVLLEMLCGFGKMSRMLGWPVKAQPSSEKGNALVKHFACPCTAIRAALEEDYAEVGDEDVDLLARMLLVDAAQRLTASEVESH